MNNRLNHLETLRSKGLANEWKELKDKFLMEAYAQINEGKVVSQDIEAALKEHYNPPGSLARWFGNLFGRTETTHWEELKTFKDNRVANESDKTKYLETLKAMRQKGLHAQWKRLKDVLVIEGTKFLKQGERMPYDMENALQELYNPPGSLIYRITSLFWTPVSDHWQTVTQLMGRLNREFQDSPPKKTDQLLDKYAGNDIQELNKVFENTNSEEQREESIHKFIRNTSYYNILDLINETHIPKAFKMLKSAIDAFETSPDNSEKKKPEIIRSIAIHVWNSEYFRRSERPLDEFNFKTRMHEWGRSRKNCEVGSFYGKPELIININAKLIALFDSESNVKFFSLDPSQLRTLRDCIKTLSDVTEKYRQPGWANNGMLVESYHMQHSKDTVELLCETLVNIQSQKTTVTPFSKMHKVSDVSFKFEDKAPVMDNTLDDDSSTTLKP